MVLSLVLDILQASLNTPSRSLLGSQLSGKLLAFLLGNTQGPVSFGTEVGLNLSFISGIFDPLLGTKNLLDSLRMGNSGVH